MLRSRFSWIVLALTSLALRPEVARASPAGLTVQLRGAYRTTESGRRSALGMLQITAPLDVVARPRASASFAHPDEAEVELEEEEEDPGADRPAPAPAVDPAAVLRGRLARQTVRRALRIAGFRRARGRLASLSGRSRSSAVLPELRLRAGRSTDQTLRLSPTSSDPARYSQTGGYDLFFEGALTWRLGRLVFASDEIAIERLRAQRAAAELRLTERVVGLLFTWHRGRLKAADAGLPPAERRAAMLDAIEAELWLDVLTDGWFGRRIGARKRGERD